MDLQTIMYIAIPSFFSVLLLAIIIGCIIKKKRNQVAKGPEIAVEDITDQGAEGGLSIE